MGVFLLLFIDFFFPHILDHCEGSQAVVHIAVILLDLVGQPFPAPLLYLLISFFFFSSSSLLMFIILRGAENQAVVGVLVIIGWLD